MAVVVLNDVGDSCSVAGGDSSAGMVVSTLASAVGDEPSDWSTRRNKSQWQRGQGKTNRDKDPK